MTVNLAPLLHELPLDEPGFDDLPEVQRARVFGVDYAVVKLSDGGELHLTRHGWPLRHRLHPRFWYEGGLFSRIGKRLGYSTGTVYRVPLLSSPRRDLVVKFTRVGQPVLLPEGNLSGRVAPSLPTQFNSPYEEFARLERLRSRRQGFRILTKRALGVYVPAKRYANWELGRNEHAFDNLARVQRADQERRGGAHPILLEPDRDYVVLFEWVKGHNLEELMEQGRLDPAQMRALSRVAAEDLGELGFQVLDHKPNHVIVRLKPDGTLVTRRGRLVYALADFELLEELPVPVQSFAPCQPEAT